MISIYFLFFDFLKVKIALSEATCKLYLKLLRSSFSTLGLIPLLQEWEVGMVSQSKIDDVHRKREVGVQWVWDRAAQVFCLLLTDILEPSFFLPLAAFWPVFIRFRVRQCYFLFLSSLSLLLCFWWLFHWNETLPPE